MTWNSYAASVFAVGAAVKGATHLGMYNNFAAVASGATNAPVIAAGWHPYDMVDVGDGNDGVIYDFSVDGAVGSVVTPDFADGYEYCLVGKALTAASSTTSFSVDLYRETDAAYTNDVGQHSYTSASSATIDFKVYLLLPRDLATVHESSGGYSYERSNASTNNLLGSVFDATVQGILKARFAFNTGNIDGGTITMLRRREYSTA